MLYIYNENPEAQWEVYEKNSSFFRIANKSCERFGIDMLQDGIDITDFNQDALQTKNNLGMPVLMMDKPTMVLFERKKLRPFLKKASEKNAQDFIFASFDIRDGRRVINQYSKNAYIYLVRYDYFKHQFHMIFRLEHNKEKLLDNNAKTFLQTIFMDKEKEHVSLRHFHYNPVYDQYKCVYKTMRIEGMPPKDHHSYIDTTDRSRGDDGTIYDFRKYIPAKPSALIFLTNGDGGTETCKNFLRNMYRVDPSKYTFVSNDDTGNLRDKLKSLIEIEHLSAVTYFIDNMGYDEMKEKRHDIREQIDRDYFGLFFNTVMVMSGLDGKILRLY